MLVPEPLDDGIGIVRCAANAPGERSQVKFIGREEPGGKVGVGPCFLRGDPGGRSEAMMPVGHIQHLVECIAQFTSFLAVDQPVFVGQAVHGGKARVRIAIEMGGDCVGDLGVWSVS